LQRVTSLTRVDSQCVTGLVNGRFAARHSCCLDQVEFTGIESGLGRAKRHRRLRIDLAGRPALRIKPGDLILNRQHNATLLQTFTTLFTPPTVFAKLHATVQLSAFAKFALPSFRLQESLPVCCIPCPFGIAESAARTLFSGCA